MYLYRPFYFLLVLLALVVTSTSCKTTSESAYFKTLKKDTTISGFVTNDFQLKIKQGDILSIEASSLNAQEDLLFNQAAGEKVSGTVSEGRGFLVRTDGTVLLHKLGNVHVEGLTRKQLALQLQSDMLPYMKDPIINVNFLNHKVTVIGAVNKPQVYNFAEDQVPLIDVLINSGDISVSGKKTDVMVIREQGTEKKVKHLNLEDNSIFSSPWYYVQPNDIVYVLADEQKARKEENRRTLQTSLALAASGVSLIIIVLDRIIK